MRERIITYLKWMDDCLEEDAKDMDYSQLMKRHLQEIAFFQHERFIHLIVMCLFAIATVMVFLTAMLQFSISLIILFAALLVLLIPYIRHYFLLENGVQKMYYQYDALYQRLHPGAEAPVFDKRPGYVK